HAVAGRRRPRSQSSTTLVAILPATVAVLLVVAVAVAAPAVLDVDRASAVFTRRTFAVPVVLPVTARHSMDGNRDVAIVDRDERTAPRARAVPPAVVVRVPERADLERVAVPVAVIDDVDAIVRDPHRAWRVLHHDHRRRRGVAQVDAETHAG